MELWVSLAACLSVLLLVSGQGFKPAGFVHQDCLNCICEATSDCQQDAGCDSAGPDQYSCGPYQISFEYWRDGGSPGADPDDPLDFERCLSDKSCSEGAIRGYMYRHAGDCDGDQDFDCTDMALLHKAGPGACNGSWVLGTEYWAKFRACRDKASL